MSSYDVPVVNQTEIVDTDFFRTVVQERRGIMIDHILDIQARKGALLLRLQEAKYVPVPSNLITAVTRVGK